MAESRLTRAWNAFRNKESDRTPDVQEIRVSYRPDRPRLRFGNERSIVASIYNRLALDVSSSKIQHVQVDENERYLKVITSGLNECLNVTANLDQTGTAFLQDCAMSMFDDGVIAIVPTDTSHDPTDSDQFDVNSMRVGKIKEWAPSRVFIDLYNEGTGKHEELWLPKRSVAIAENPFYAIMNEPNSIAKRLISKLNLMDSVDNIASSTKLDMIVQLPYGVKTDKKQERAEARLEEIREQLENSELGIAYMDATEKITQLNRPVENKLMPQIEYLTSILYGQLGLTTSIMDGTADEATMLNYNKRTIKPIATAVVEAMYRTFISKNARSRGQRLMLYSDPFMLVPMSSMAEIADKFTRNEVLSSNDMRSIIGFKPDPNPESDKLRNKNMPDELPKGGIDLDADA